MAYQDTERRKSKRVDASLRLEVRLSGEDGTVATSALQTLNISTSGCYFRSDHFIEPMTKLAMAMQVTVPGLDGDSGPRLASIECEGLVVRVEPEHDDPAVGQYDVAVFFTAIEPEGLAALEQHIALLLETI
ncbi:MAG: PilZ domain-containing protein [Candidatus Krumholzibacteriia bacterium]